MTSWVPFDLLDHLWQSTLFTAAVWLAARALRANGARVRYWLWFAASMKFLIPLSLLVNAGERFAWPTEPVVAPPVVSFVIDQVLTPAGSAWSSTGQLAETVPLGEPVASPATIIFWLLLAAWAAGVTFVLLSWWRQWLPFRRARADAQAIDLTVEYDAGGLTIMASPSMIEPGVFGIRRPVLLVPEGISDRLAPAQLRALIAHEHCHVRHRDNLTAALHMAVEAVFWFCPVVWWIERRLIDERERACDEYVLRSGSTPHDYAEGILEVCRFATEPPPAFVAGVTGSDLARRIRSILREEIGRPLGGLRAVVLGGCCTAVGLGPVLAGAAQQPAGITAAAFDVPGIRKNPTNVET
jgi:beta-lactamase regulating signal transducer with metallopeptidase domain